MVDLAVQYRQSKRAAQGIIIQPNEYINESEVVQGMITDLDYSLRWLDGGEQPDAFRPGLTAKRGYARRLLLDTERFPCLDLEPVKPSVMEDDKKRIIGNVLNRLTDRQLTCYLLHTAHMRTYEEIGRELGLKATTIQNHVERAQKKVNEVAAQYGYENIK